MQLSDAIALSPELMREFQKERLVIEVGELISGLMREKNINRAELAKRLGKSKPFVTKLLRTGSNMTVRTLADVFFALGYSLRVVERPLSVFTPKLDVTESLGESKGTLMWALEPVEFSNFSRAVALTTRETKTLHVSCGSLSQIEFGQPTVVSLAQK